MTPSLLALLSEGENAQIKLEKNRHAEEVAKAAVEAAKAAFDAAKSETAQSLVERDEVLGKAEQAGVQRKPFRALVEDRVTALVNSGLFNLSEAVAVATVPVKPKVTRRREAEATAPAATQVPASSNEAEQGDGDVAEVGLAGHEAIDASVAPAKVHVEVEHPAPVQAVTAPVASIPDEEEQTFDAGEISQASILAEDVAEQETATQAAPAPAPAEPVVGRPSFLTRRIT